MLIGFAPKKPHRNPSQTTPEVPGLHGLLVGDLRHEWAGGVFLQTFEPAADAAVIGVSWLVYLDLATLQWQRVQEVGQCVLESVSGDSELLRGDLPDGGQLLLRFTAGHGTAAERQSYPSIPLLS